MSTGTVQPPREGRSCRWLIDGLSKPHTTSPLLPLSTPHLSPTSPYSTFGTDQNSRSLVARDTGTPTRNWRDPNEDETWCRSNSIQTTIKSVRYYCTKNPPLLSLSTRPSVSESFKGSVGQGVLTDGEVATQSRGNRKTVTEHSGIPRTIDNH